MKHASTLLTISIFLFLSSPAAAQQPGHYSLYMLNKFNWNPAYAGLDHSLSFTGFFRKQWVGLEGSPTSQNLNIHMPLYIAGGGIGINMENDVLGAERSTGATLAYNFQLPLGSGILALGLSGGLMQRALDGSKLRTPQGNYENVIQHNDDLLPVNQETAMVPTFGAGLYYQSEWLEFGVAARNLAESQADFSTVSIQLKRSYFATLDLHFEIGDAFKLHPSAFLRTDLIQTQIEGSLRLQYNDNIFGGASLRGYNANSIDAVAILLGFKLNEKIMLGYAYDITLSDLNAVSNGSHEIMLNYNLNQRIGEGRPPNIIYNPRSL